MSESWNVSEGWGDPARERGEQASSWLHVPASGSIEVVMINPAPVRYRGHWIAGQMVGCKQVGCEWCDRRVGAQVRYVFRVWRPDVQVAQWLELGACTADDIASQMPGDSLRMLRFELWKYEGKARGRIHAKRVPYSAGYAGLPEPEDPREVLAALWRRGV